MMNIQEILTTKNINKLVYVDDELNKTSYYDNAKAKIRQLVENGYTNDSYPFFSNTEIWEEIFEKWWETASFNDIIVLSNSFNFKRSTTIIANKLSEILPKSCELVLLAPEQFDETYKTNIIKELYETKANAIILVDYELDGYTVNGDQLLDSIAGQECVFCGIYSQTFDVTEEISKWQSRNFNPNVYPISKKRFNGQNATDLTTKGLKNVIWLKQIESIKKMATKLVTYATETLDNELKKIDPATFDRLIIANAKEEGCWEFDYLSRIMQIYLNRGIKNEMQNIFADFQKETNTIRDFHDERQHEFVNDELLKSLGEEESYDNITYVNSIYSTIANGDIFLIKGKYFILLAQPCNLSIRGDGRRSYDLDQAFLVPLYGNEKHLGTFCEELQYPFNKTFCHVSFVDRQRVSLSILDLVSYNRNGEATIDIHINSENLPGHEIMQDNLLKRYNKIKDKISSIHQTYELALNGRNDNNTINLFSKYFCKPLMGGEKVAVKPKIEASKISFDIKRVGRYNSYGAHVLLQQFMSYMSRPEFPAKFDRC